MARHHFRIVNVFAETTFGGNPLCVFEDATGMSDETMQSLARQFNLSETTFVLPSAQADARIRIFTTSHEMRFAGHPALGSAHVVRDLLGAGDKLTLEFKAGIVPVAASGDAWTFSAPVSGAPATRSPGLPRDFIARLVGLSEGDLAGEPLWVDAGADQLLIPVATAAAVRRAAPASDLLAQWPVSSLGRKTAYVFAFDGEQNGKMQVLARYFFTTQGGGFGEDPGTGSACANLGGWLIANRLALPAQLEIRQGEAVNRPCRLLLDVTNKYEIRVGGRVIELGRGHVDI
ncbi:PhzF family phenazine biosynthesis protein [Noviherbaspirillum cavernae]|uniref:PhzF family phenazine biosynthesis protein n=1 Tax=Noviherbaspirillum cavernae TaxID=2320862 RepID=A0A418X659_9BURK|nr:PhzF family phenazine biosynthesis protein [Noviherbaspirillum cavernae]RJG07977.1 PhzF family phenazine biosynthesis protein [Noviherbaspirillum cavernae]